MTEHNLFAAFERVFGAPMSPRGDDVYDFDPDDEPVTDSEARHMQLAADSRTVDLFGLGGAA